MRMRRRAALPVLLATIVSVSLAPPAEARMARAVTLGELVQPAGRIVRARCLSAEAGTVKLAGAELAATTYTFDVSDTLKGTAGDRLVFRQIGTRERGPRDLGARVGLPVYAPGTEYVLFLLPEGRLGLTSPAGAGDGAFVVRDERVTSMTGTVHLEPAAPAGARTTAAPGGSASAMPYDGFRALVRDAVTR